MSHRPFYDQQVAFLESKNIEGIVSQYHPDAVLIGFDFTVRGRDALRRHFAAYLAKLGSLKVLSTDRFTETEDSFFFEATVDTTHAIARVYDVFLMRDGKATRQWTGVLSLQPKS